MGQRGTYRKNSSPLSGSFVLQRIVSRVLTVFLDFVGEPVQSRLKQVSVFVRGSGTNTIVGCNIDYLLVHGVKLVPPENV